LNEEQLHRDFVHAAEAGGLMPRIDNLMLFRCVQVARRLMSKNRDVGLFCNLSASTLVDAAVFPQLTEDDILQIVDLMIGRVDERLRDRDMGIELSSEAKSLLSKRGYDPVLGARPLRRTIQREIEDALSEKILFDEIGAGQLITVDVDNWDGEAANIEDAVFTFVGNKRVSADAEAGADPALAGAPGSGGTTTATATE